jgi:hypothetical protein
MSLEINAPDLVLSFAEDLALLQGLWHSGLGRIYVVILGAIQTASITTPMISVVCSISLTLERNY